MTIDEENESNAARGIVIEWGVKDMENDDRMREHLSNSFVNLVNLVKRYEMHEETHSIMVSMLTSTWTAMEVLIVDTLKLCDTKFQNFLASPWTQKNVQKLINLRAVYADVFCDPAICQALGQQAITGL